MRGCQWLGLAFSKPCPGCSSTATLGGGLIHSTHGMIKYQACEGKWICGLEIGLPGWVGDFPLKTTRLASHELKERCL